MTSWNCLVIQLPPGIHVDAERVRKELLDVPLVHRLKEYELYYRLAPILFTVRTSFKRERTI